MDIVDNKPGMITRAVTVTVVMMMSKPTPLPTVFW
jgi:hypothetical protein